MSLKEKIENHPMYLVMGIAVASFVSGWVANGTIISTSGRTVVTLEQAKLIETYEENGKKLNEQTLITDQKFETLEANYKKSRDDLAETEKKVIQLENQISQYESQANNKNQTVESLLSEKTQHLERVLILEKTIESLRQQLAERYEVSKSDNSNSKKAIEPVSASQSEFTVYLGKAAVRVPSGESIALSRVTRDGDGRRAANFYINGKETKERVYPGQHVSLLGNDGATCLIEMLTIDGYSSTVRVPFATFSYLCRKS
ncbi:MAG: hypothetical protein V9E92_07415 [Methylotenera sp.]